MQPGEGLTHNPALSAHKFQNIVGVPIWRSYQSHLPHVGSFLLRLESFGAGGSVPPEWEHISAEYPVPRDARDSSGIQATPFTFHGHGNHM